MTSSLSELVLLHRQHALHFRDRDHRQEPREQQEQRQEQTEGARRTCTCPRTSDGSSPTSVGRKSRVKLVAIITKRSNHMPIFVVMLMTNITHRLLRMLLNQYNCGMKTLQVYIDHAAHQ